MHDLSLISLVRRYEELYNTQHSGYSNHSRRDNVWEEIGKHLSANGIQCRERWQRIRENFRKALNLRKTKRDQGAENIKPPKYHKELSFLLPHLNEEEDKKSKTGSILDTQNPPSPIDSPEENSQFSDSSLSNVAKYAPAPKRRFTEPIASSDPPNTSEIMLKQSSHTLKEDAPPNLTQSPDPLIDFFLTMARTVKTFPRNKQLDIKGQLFQMVHNVEIELMNEEYSNKPAERSFEIVNVSAAVEDITHTPFKIEPPNFL